MRTPVLAPLAVLAAVLATALTGCSSGPSPRPPSSASASSASPSTPSTTTTATTPSATPTGPEAQVDAALARLDRRAQVAQLFVVGVPLSDLAAGDGLARSGIGGIFLSGRSTAAATALAATTGRWAALSPGPRPWVACDQEGGQVQTLTGPGFARLPSALQQGQLPPDQLAALAGGLGASLHAAGVTLDLAPVADIVPAGTAAQNPPIGAYQREYGSTAAQVVPAARTVVDGLATHGVTATLKHFPGLGRVRANTDTTAGVTDTVTTPGDPQVAAFGTLARDPAHPSVHPFVMVSTATYTLIDPAAPAAYSPTVVTGLLRQQLGFDGVVISDDLANAKSAQAYPAGERAVRFLAAGGTLVLIVNPSLLPSMLDAVLARDAADPAFAAQVTAAVRTALLAKARAGLLGP